MRPLRELQAAIITHSYATGPAQELLAYLRPRVPFLAFIDHPFSYAHDIRSSLTVWQNGEQVKRRVAPAFRGVPELFRYAKDFLLTLLYLFSIRPRPDICFAADNLNALSALVARGLGRVGRVVFYTVDYAPQRFSNRWLSALYLRMDSFCCRHADGVWNLSPAMEKAREERGLAPEKCAPQIVVPLGNNFHTIKRRPVADIDRHALVYMGHLRPNQGLELVIEAMPAIRRSVPQVHLTVVGDGPLMQPLLDRAEELGLRDCVEFTGFIEDHARVEEILAGCAIGLAPYEPSPDSFTYFADPSKPKTYMACGLPVIITVVPRIADDITREGAGIVIPYQRESLSEAVVHLLTDQALYRQMRERAIAFAAGFAWPTVFARALQVIGYSE